MSNKMYEMRHIRIYPGISGYIRAYPTKRAMGRAGESPRESSRDMERARDGAEDHSGKREQARWRAWLLRPARGFERCSAVVIVLFGKAKEERHHQIGQHTFSRSTIHLPEVGILLTLGALVIS